MGTDLPDKLSLYFTHHLGKALCILLGGFLVPFWETPLGKTAMILPHLYVIGLNTVLRDLGGFQYTVNNMPMKFIQSLLSRNMRSY